MPTFFPRSLFRYFLWIPRVRKWYDKLHSPDRLLGAPINEERLGNHFKQQAGSFLTLWCPPLTRLYRKNNWVKFRTFCVRPRIRTIKPVRPHKKFIITLTRLPQSAQAAERCIESAKRHGEEPGLEIVSATDKFEALDFFKQHGLTWLHIDDNFKSGKDPLPEMGCFASHYKLWQRCIELNEPIIVLEHDAVFVSPIPSLRFKHVIMLSKPYYQPENIDVLSIMPRVPKEVFYPMDRLSSGHGYAVTPEGAHRLVAAAHRQLAIPTDAFINKRKVDILDYQPYLIDFDTDFSTIDVRPQSKTTPEEIWKNYKR